MNLKKYTYAQIKKIASSLHLEQDKTRSELEKEILSVFSQYEQENYTKTEIFNKQKDVIFYNVKESNNLLMKVYKKTKSGKKIKSEYSFLRKSGKAGIAPRAIDYDTIHKYIIMEKMDAFFQNLNKNRLTKKNQERIIEILDKLDELKIYYNNFELDNYVEKDGQLYLMNFENAKEHSERLIRKLKTNKPNRLLLVGLIIKLKDNNFDSFSYKYLLKHVSQENRDKYLKNL